MKALFHAIRANSSLLGGEYLNNARLPAPIGTRRRITDTPTTQKNPQPIRLHKKIGEVAKMAETNANKRRSRALAAARREAEAAQKRAEELQREAEQLEADEVAAERAQEARLGLAGAVYDVLGVEPEPRREAVRQVKRSGRMVSEMIRVDRDLKEVARAKWAGLLLERMVEKLGSEGMASLRADVESERQQARDADDAKRAEREAEKRAEREAEGVVEAPPVNAGLVPPTVSPAQAVSHDSYYGDEK